MRILAGLTVAAALVALSGVPAIAECNWGKIAQSKPQTSVAGNQDTGSSAIATNDLSLETIRAETSSSRTTSTAE
jgi:hypothetical protein